MRAPPVTRSAFANCYLYRIKLDTYCDTIIRYNSNQKTKMKISSLFILVGVNGGSTQVKTMFERPDEDRKVPERHPLQRLWRLYQFSEEIIQKNFYQSDIPARKLDRIRGRIGKWQYQAMRQSYLRGKATKGIALRGEHHTVV